MECGAGLFMWGGVVYLFVFFLPLIRVFRLVFPHLFQATENSSWSVFSTLVNFEEVLSEDSSDLVMTTLTSYLAGKELGGFQKLHKFCIY